MADLKVSLSDSTLSISEKVTLDSKVVDINKVQATYIAKNPKYLQTKEVNLDDMKYEVHEIYKPSTKEKGYVTIFRKTVDGEEYIKTVGYGLDSKSNTKDWFRNYPLSYYI